MSNTKMDEITTEMAEFICDKRCKYACDNDLTQEELDEFCAECKFDKFIVDILNEHIKEVTRNENKE